jgi:exopolysaccharide biosynthesis predicted pyruvyltransferase EpsI
VNSYKEKEKELQGGMFANESHRITENDRKRKSDEISHDTAPRDIWSEFENIMMQGGGNRGDMYSQSAGRVDVNNVR